VIRTPGLRPQLLRSGSQGRKRRDSRGPSASTCPFDDKGQFHRRPRGRARTQRRLARRLALARSSERECSHDANDRSPRKQGEAVPCIATRQKRKRRDSRLPFKRGFHAVPPTLSAQHGVEWRACRGTLDRDRARPLQPLVGQRPNHTSSPLGDPPSQPPLKQRGSALWLAAHLTSIPSTSNARRTVRLGTVLRRVPSSRSSLKAGLKAGTCNASRRRREPLFFKRRGLHSRFASLVCSTPRSAARAAPLGHRGPRLLHLVVLPQPRSWGYDITRPVRPGTREGTCDPNA